MGKYKDFEQPHTDQESGTVRRGLCAIGNTALRYELTSAQSELLLSLPQPKPPTFLRNFANYCSSLDLSLEDIRANDRPLLAHYAYGYIEDIIIDANHKAETEGKPQFLLWPKHAEVPTKLNKYYAAYSSSLGEHEGELLRRRRLSDLERDAVTARSYLRFNYADLTMVAGLEHMMADFYPGNAAEATTELLAAYGAHMERFKPHNRTYGTPAA